MKIRTLALASLLVVSSVVTVRATSFSDIQNWVGSGANEAAMVVDWKDGKTDQSMVWGYRWDGTATGLNMFLSIVAADPNLYAHAGTYSWGTAIYGIGYDLGNSGSFSVTPSLTFDSGGLATSTDPNDARVATDSANHYVEGWNSGFWDYYTKATATDVWAESGVGAADRVLTDGAWDGYSFAAGFASAAPNDPIAAPLVSSVPEPTTLALSVTAGLILVCVRRKKS